MKIGYARVSTDDQSIALQMDALLGAGCCTIFRDEGVSGALVRRPALDQLLATVRPGNVVVVWRLDRLGRSLSHLINLIASLRKKGVGFVSLSEAIDTNTAGGRLLFHVMGALAEFERTLIGERTRAGMIAARARGAKLGRPRRLAWHEIETARVALEGDCVTLSELARRMGIPRPTLARAIKTYVR